MAGYESFTWVLSVLIVDSRVVLEQGEPRPAGREETLQPWEASEAGGELEVGRQAQSEVQQGGTALLFLLLLLLGHRQPVVL